MTLSDPFAPGAPPAVGTVTLEGEILDPSTSSEIDVVPTGVSSSGAVVTLIKTVQFGACNNASVSGNFGVLGQGMVTSAGITPTPTTITGAFNSGVTGTLGTPFNLLGRFVADGTGILGTDVAATSDPVKRLLTGTYLVNADCTGTAHLVDSAATARNIGFVLVNASAVPTSAREQLRFVFTDTGVFGTGVADQQ
jgi:hypothetical protein